MKAGTTLPVCKRAGCEKPAMPIAGHRKKEYCSQACRQLDYRNRKRDATEQEIERLRTQLETPSQLQEARIAELEKMIQEARQYIAELEERVHEQQAQSMFEEALRTDTQVRYFKQWLKKRPQPRDSDFAKRFLADSRLPQHASRAVYEAKLRACGYSAEDVFLFRDMWLTLILEQS